MRGHGHARPHLLFLATGGFMERVDGGGARGVHLCTSGGLRRSPAGDSHDIEFGDQPTIGLLVEIDGELQPESSVFRGFEERAFHQSHEFATRAHRVARALSLPHPGPETLLVVEGWLLEVLARLDLSRREEMVAAPPRWLRTLRERLSSETLDRPSFCDLSHAAGVHPVYAARAFRRFYGCSAGQLVRRERLARAARSIRSTNGSLSEIAARYGFSDQSHLTREMKRALGQTPHHLRLQRLQHRLARPSGEVSPVQDLGGSD